jgi:hypothetical protein
MNVTLRRAVVLVVVIDAIGLWPFAYRNGYGHGDLRAMQMALYAKDGASVPVYGEGFSFAWYWLGRAVRATVAPSPHAFPPIINTAAVAASTAADVLLLTVLASAVAVDVALIAAVLWRFTPEVWEVSTYAHPWTLALPLFLAATLTATAPARRTLWSGALFLLAFAMRADIILLVPPAMALAYLRRPEWLRPILVSSAAGTIGFFVIQRFTMSGPLSGLFAVWAHGPIGWMRWLVNFGVFACGGGLLSIAAVPVVAAVLWRFDGRRRELSFLLLALVPTLALWSPHGGPARHFGPVYLVTAVLLAHVITAQYRGAAVRGLVTLAMIAGNALAGEAAYVEISRLPFRSMQVGENRRVVEGVPLGNVWSNHRAQVRMNAIENADVAWTLRCAAGGSSMAVAEESPYWLVTLASEQFGPPSVERRGIYRFGDPVPHLWVADIPEDSSSAWWNALQERERAVGRTTVLLGPRIPKSFGDVAATPQRCPSSPDLETASAR